MELPYHIQRLLSPQSYSFRRLENILLSGLQDILTDCRHSTQSAMICPVTCGPDRSQPSTRRRLGALDQMGLTL